MARAVQLAARWFAALEDSLRRLELAAHPHRADGAEEAIHDARVATRRLDALLRLVTHTPKGRTTRDARRRLRRLRRGLSDARDAEVTLAWWRAAGHPGEDQVSRALARRVARGRQRAVSQAQRQSDRLRASVTAALATIPAQVDERKFRRRLARLAARVATRAREASQARGTSAGQRTLHALRIAVKTMRYGFEVVEALGVGGPWRGTASQRQAEFKQVQEGLGALMDDVSAARLLRRMRVPSAQEAAQRLRARATETTAGLTAALRHSTR